MGKPGKRGGKTKKQGIIRGKIRDKTGGNQGINKGKNGKKLEKQGKKDRKKGKTEGKTGIKQGKTQKKPRNSLFIPIPDAKNWLQSLGNSGNSTPGVGIWGKSREFWELSHPRRRV